MYAGCSPKRVPNCTPPNRTGVDQAEANRLRQHYWKSYGTTLAGLMREHGIDPAPYLQDVHDIDFTVLPADPDLAARLHERGSQGAQGYNCETYTCSHKSGFKYANGSGRYTCRYCGLGEGCRETLQTERRPSSGAAELIQSSLHASRRSHRRRPQSDAPEEYSTKRNQGSGDDSYHPRSG